MFGPVFMNLFNFAVEGPHAEIHTTSSSQSAIVDC